MLNIAVIGYGYWGPNLVRNFDLLEDARVAWCIDRDPDRRALVAGRYPAITTGDDAAAAIDDDRVDAVAIATPVSTHHGLAKRALEHGKHVYVEKPLASSVAEAEELVELAGARNLTLMVGHTFLYTGAVRVLKRIVDEGSLGNFFYFDSVRVNLGLFQRDVDVIWDLAPHDLSILHHLIPETPTGVTAIGADHTGSGRSDMAYITLHYASDFLAHFHVNWLSPVKVRQLMLAGDRKMLVYDDMALSEKVRVYDRGVDVKTKESMYQTMVEYRSGDMWAPKLDSTEALSLLTADFVGAIRDRRPPLASGASGLGVVRLLEAASRSLAAGGARVSI